MKPPRRATKHEKKMQDLQIVSVLLGLFLSFFVIVYSVFAVQNYLLGAIGVGIFTVSIRALFNPNTLGEKTIS